MIPTLNPEVIAPPVVEGCLMTLGKNMRRKITEQIDLLDQLISLIHYIEDGSYLNESEQIEFMDDLLNARDGIEYQISKSKEKVQRNWYSESLLKVDLGIEEYRKENYRKAYEFITDAEEIFRSGINAAERKTNFVVAPDGIVRSTTKPKTQQAGLSNG